MSRNPTAVRDAVNNRTQDWRAEFEAEKVLRFTRTPDRKIKSLLENSFEPRVHLKHSAKRVEIVFEFRLDTEPVPSHVRKNLARQGITRSSAFESVLYRKLDREAAWSQMAMPVVKTYSKAWVQFFSWAYKDHFHTRVNRWLEDIGDALEDRLPVSKGRKSRTKGEIESLQRRFDQLFPICQKIQSAAKNTSARSRRERRKMIWHEVKGDVNGMPGDNRIFGGQAFQKIPHEKNVPILEYPSSRKPRQLAISLLAWERDLSYRTLARLLSANRAGPKGKLVPGVGVEPRGVVETT